MKKALEWLDTRTGYRELLHELLLENIPGGARWRYVWGSTLTFCFSVLVITGLALWAAYSPSSQTAWESVYYIQNEMTGGWFLRGIHHFTAQAMIVLLVLHLVQVVIDGAYKAPREVNYWFGIGLLLLTLALSLTGYLLPWDQKGYWATKVATSMVGTTPIVGPTLQTIIVGGTEYGHHTLTRFFALHAGVLPALVVLLIFWHIFLFRRHGITAKKPIRKPDAHFWPDQVLADLVACFAVMAAVLLLTIRAHGADLGPPADPTENYDAARPEWYFLFLYQFLKYFPGGAAIWGSVILPGLGLAILAAFPIIGQWKLGHRFNCGYLAAILVGATLLTYLALHEDRNKPDYQMAVRSNDANGSRIVQLAKAKGIPAEGALALLYNDPLTQGPKVFKEKCASCHSFDGSRFMERSISSPKKDQSASNLMFFASREWIAGLLDPKQIETADYFGATHFSKPPAGGKKGKMVKFVTEEVAEYNDTKKAQLQKVIIALSAEAKLSSQRDADASDAALIEEGRRLFGEDGLSCSDCHEFHGGKSGSGPDLTGYGSREWLIAFIKNPEHAEKPKFYPNTNDRMPIYEKELDDKTIGLVADWLRGDGEK